MSLSDKIFLHISALCKAHPLLYMHPELAMPLIVTAVTWLVQSRGNGDIFVLSTQLVVSRGIYKLVELAEDVDPAISQPAISALHHLSTTSRRFMANLMRATDNAPLLAAIEAGVTGERLSSKMRPKSPSAALASLL